MKANELMVGDWAHLHYKEYGTTRDVHIDFQVSQIRKNGFDDEEDTYVWGVEHGNMGNVKYIEPIVLNSDILRRNGFTDCTTSVLDRENDNWYWYLGEGNYISNSDLLINLHERSFNVRYNNNSVFGLRYVHELQHALRLFGVGKKIEL